MVKNEWFNYIENNGERPKPTGKTIIWSNHSEKAIYKPIVNSKLANKKGKIFFDSGSEMIFYSINYKMVTLVKIIRVLALTPGWQSECCELKIALLSSMGRTG